MTLTGFLADNGKLQVSSFIGDNGRGQMEQQVGVEFDNLKFSREETCEIGAEIDKRWEEITRNNPRIYNASKFRLASHVVNNDGNVELCIGLTDYKDHLGTNLSPLVDQWVGEAEARYSKMSQCIGVGAWTLTTDNKIVLIERAMWTGEGAGQIDRPGGHAEPDEAGDKLKDLSNDKVQHELFHCIQRELRDEVNIGLNNQRNPELLGVIFNLERGGRCSLDFLIVLDIDSHQVEDLYKKGGSEADESTNLFFINIDDIKNNKIDQQIFSKFTPHARGSIELLKKRLQFDI